MVPRTKACVACARSWQLRRSVYLPRVRRPRQRTDPGYELRHLRLERRTGLAARLGGGLGGPLLLRSSTDSLAHNRTTADPAHRKHVFFICHSFQLAVRYFNAGEITARRSWSFGTFPVNSSNAGDRDPLFDGLDDPFWVADFREYQVLHANHTILAHIGGSVLAFEKVRDHVPLERAVMAIRFSREWVGTQFHPEADAEGMIIHFNDPNRRRAIYDEYGEEKYRAMMRDLHDPERIDKTNTIVIPNFLRAAIAQLSERKVPSPARA